MSRIDVSMTNINKSELGKIFVEICVALVKSMFMHKQHFFCITITFGEKRKKYNKCFQ